MSLQLPKSWYKDLSGKVIPNFKGKWFLMTAKGEPDRTVETVTPRYIFILHWSWIVPDDII